MARENMRRSGQSRAAAAAGRIVHSRLALQLATIAAVVLAFTVSISIFFKVDTITVSGAEKHSAWSVCEASGIEKGDSLLFFGRSKAAGKIKAALPYVDTVRFEVTLPGTVNIIVKEKPVAYALQGQDGSWWLMTSDGKIVEQTTEEAAANRIRITGVTLADPREKEMAVAAEAQQSGELVSVTAADKLKTALSILFQLERFELFDRMTEVDVSNVFALRLYCGGQYRIEMGDSADLSGKMAAVNGTLQQLGVSDSGVLKLLYRDEMWQVLHQSWSQP